MNVFKNNNSLALSVCKVWFVRTLDVLSIVRDLKNPHSLRLNFKTGKGWVEIYGSPSSKKYTENTREHGAGEWFDQKLELVYPSDSVSNLVDFDNIEQYRFILRYMDSRGVNWVVGSKDCPMYMKQDKNVNGEASRSVVFYRAGDEIAKELVVL